ncbi:MAG: hypothetical protein R3F35_21050 [Myxococcota bacterium]
MSSISLRKPLRSLVLALCAGLAPFGADAAVLGKVSMGYASGSNPGGGTQLDFSDVADEALGPIANASPSGATIATQGAFGETALSVGGLSLAGSTLCETVATAGTVYRSAAFGQIRYDEMLTVTSSTLPIGTPVSVGVRYSVAAVAEALHDLDPALVQSLADQQADADVSLTVGLQAGGVQDATDSFLLVRVGFAPTVTGVFAEMDGTDDLVVATTVGSQIRLRITAQVSPQTRTSPHQAGIGTPVLLPIGLADAGLGVVFGVETDTPGVEVVSPLLGAPFPDFGNVTPYDAEAFLPPLPVPEPGRIEMLRSAMLALLCALPRKRRG